ncbi:MAG TPA: AAA family ATPase [Candidatus Obscuribacterales bacterium]
MTIDCSTRFLITKQYRRFAEICNRSQREQVLSLVFGKTGLGKTRSAMHYSQWNVIEPLLGKPLAARNVPRSLVGCTTAVFTPDVRITPKKLQSGIGLLRNRFDELMDQANLWYSTEIGIPYPQQHLRLLIIDEADRLSFSSFEWLRDLHDRTNMSILLLGSAGMERRLLRTSYLQFYSRLNFIHEMTSLNSAEMRTFIHEKWQELRLPCSEDDALSAAIMRIADGNFRRLHRIFVEIERLQRLNRLPQITLELIDAARQGLLLGTPQHS